MLKPVARTAVCTVRTTEQLLETVARGPVGYLEVGGKERREQSERYPMSIRLG